MILLLSHESSYDVMFRLRLSVPDSLFQQTNGLAAAYPRVNLIILDYDYPERPAPRSELNHAKHGAK